MTSNTKKKNFLKVSLRKGIKIQVFNRRHNMNLQGLDVELNSWCHSWLNHLHVQSKTFLSFFTPRSGLDTAKTKEEHPSLAPIYIHI